MHDREALSRLEEDLAGAGGGNVLEDVLRHAGGTRKEWVRWTLGRQVWFLRLSHDLTQAELGRRAGVAQSHVAKVEQGRDVQIGTLRGLFGALGYELLIVPYPRGEAFGDLPRPRRRVQDRRV